MLQALGAHRAPSQTLLTCSMFACLTWLGSTAQATDLLPGRPVPPQPISQQKPTLVEADETELAEDESYSEHVRILEKGTSSRAARKTAVDGVPLGRMTVENRKRAEELLRSISLYRQLPTVAFEVDPDVYRYFIACPDAAVAIWRVMGISKFQMWQTAADQYEADAGDGTQGVVDVLLRSDDHNVIVCEGVFSSPLLAAPIRSKALLHLETAFLQDQEGRTWAKHRLNMFVSFPSQTVEAAAKLISPVSNLIVDRNFREISLFVQLMSTAMARQPGWVERVADRMEGVPEIRKTQLLKLTAQVYVAACKREAASAGGDVSIDEILKPFGNPSAAARPATGVPRVASGTAPQ